MTKRLVCDILVAIPSPQMLSLVVDTIQRSGSAHVRGCSSSRDMFDSIRQRSFDLIVLSDMLSDPDPPRLVRMLRSGRFCAPDIPIILVCRHKSGNGAAAIAQSHNVYPIELKDINAIQKTTADALAQIPKSKVLVIEDDPAIGKLVCMALDKNFNVTICNDGERGLATWAQNDFDLVLLDLLLPDMSGEKILECMIEQKPDQLVIIITAHGNSNRHQRLIEKGAFDFVDKPFDINRLRSLCLQIISERAHAEADRSSMQYLTRLNRIGQRVHAASADLKRGRVAIAARHLDHACIEQPMELTDDEWIELVAEFYE